jgi:aryl-alcohol dehydrogenase-like predicted oxidoreductase
MFVNNVSKLALGTVQLGLPYGISNFSGQTSLAEARNMLKFALANGLDTLDTAIAYGDSEMRLGEVGTQGFKLVSKLPALPDGCANVGAWVKRQTEESMSRMGVNSIYGMLLHKPDQLLGPNGVLLYQALQALKDRGQVQKVGVSIYSPSELDKLTQNFHFDLVQAPFSLVDRRLHSTGWMQRLKDDGVEVHTRSVFLQGLLLMAATDIPNKFAKWNDLWRTWHKWLADCGGSAVQACLAFPLSFCEIDRVVVGANSLSQLAQIVSAANGQAIDRLPDLRCEDENLINPARWSTL